MKTTRQPRMGLTFEQVWAALMELSEKVDKTTLAVAQTTARVAQTTLAVAQTTAGLDTLEAKVAQTTLAVAQTAARVDQTTANVDKTTAGLDTLEAKVAQTTLAVAQTAARDDQRAAHTTANLDTLGAKVDQTTLAVAQTTAGLDTLEAKVAQTTANVDKVTKNVGGLNRSMGELIETIIAAKLWEKFDAYPYNLKRSYQRVPLYDENSNVLTDIDILLSNGDYVMAVEVKRELDKKDDIDHHLKRMELIKKYPPIHIIINKYKPQGGASKI
ncbi:hypothetical protein FACS1894102_7820 [Spirochaetia bacterium]|nr:hypothetical protein FACS1894102_7820 [Spirochaetia bacterium]